MRGLAGKVAVVTGGAHRIGQASAARLAEGAGAWDAAALDQSLY
jgi:NAD(P)-dependent dehydrogenase (short-subunit alcohol dehydrogenase family)